MQKRRERQKQHKIRADKTQTNLRIHIAQTVSNKCIHMNSQSRTNDDDWNQAAPMHSLLLAFAIAQDKLRFVVAWAGTCLRDTDGQRKASSPCASA